jgi:hypothetical protein
MLREEVSSKTKRPLIGFQGLGYIVENWMTLIGIYLR